MAGQLPEEPQTPAMQLYAMRCGKNSPIAQCALLGDVAGTAAKRCGPHPIDCKVNAVPARPPLRVFPSDGLAASWRQGGDAIAALIPVHMPVHLLCIHASIVSSGAAMLPSKQSAMGRHSGRVSCSHTISDRNVVTPSAEDVKNCSEKNTFHG